MDTSRAPTLWVRMVCQCFLLLRGRRVPCQEIAN
jgi:hypothetical protein